MNTEYYFFKCEKCNKGLHFFTGKKCVVCGRFFCKKHLVSERKFPFKSSCQSCLLLKSGRFTQQELKDYTVKELKYFLKNQNVPVGNCVEKEDLVNLVFRSFSLFTSSQDVELLEHQRRVESMKVVLSQKLEQSANRTTNATEANSIAVVTTVTETYGENEEADTDDDDDGEEEEEEEEGGVDEENDWEIIEQNIIESEEGLTSLNSQSPALQVSSDNHSSFPVLPNDNPITLSSFSTTHPSNSSSPSVPLIATSNNPLTSHDSFFFPLPPSYQELFSSQNDENQHNSQQDNQTMSQTLTTSTSKKPTKNFDYIVRLDQIESVQDIDELSIRQLKIILSNNFVTSKGCCEKKELSILVLKLYQEHLKNLQTEKTVSSSSSHSLDLCKICMEHMIDCVLLECGHMVSCTECSKRLQQCPICRDLVSRVVHIFKA